MKKRNVVFITIIYIGLFMSTLFADTLTIKIKGDSIVNTMSDKFFGHNYWLWSPSWGNTIRGTDSRVAELKVKFLRFGGMSADLGFPDKVTKGVVDDFNIYCKNIGAEPFFQIPLACFTKTEDKQANAPKMIEYFKKWNNLSVVSIGNEPDIYSGNLSTNPEYHAEYLDKYSLENYCADYNAVASVVKKEYPNLKIVGLELSNKYAEWVPGFVKNCKENIDMISLHYYPFSAAQCSYTAAKRQYDDIKDFLLQMRMLINRNADGKSIPLIIGETNITWDGEPVKSKHEASPGTFAAALWFADLMGVASAEKNLYSLMPWSIREDWTLGFLTAHERPVFYAYKMFSTLYKNKCIFSEKVSDAVRVYGYKDDKNNVSLYTVNWDTLQFYPANFYFEGILKNEKYSYTIPPFSLSCITLSADMSQKTIYVYTKKIELDGPLNDKSPRYKSLFTKNKPGFFRFKPL